MFLSAFVYTAGDADGKTVTAWQQLFPYEGSWLVCWYNTAEYKQPRVIEYCKASASRNVGMRLLVITHNALQ